MASTTSTNGRKWNPHSERWRKELKELANMKDTEVMRVGGLTFVPKEKRFWITMKGQTLVLLGLRDDGTEVAIKRMLECNFSDNLQKELKVLRNLMFNSLHVVQYVDFTSDSNFGYIAMQLCEFNLEEYIKQRQPADSERKKIAREFLEGLKDLHEKNVIHRDIKPHNIFIDTDEQVRLADFGISCILNPGQTTMETDRAGTKYWEATEIIRGQPEDQKPRYKRSTDIQVAGMLVYYILSGGRHPFGDDGHCQANILDGKYTLEHLKDEEAKDLVESMININPEERPRITKVLEHPYFWEEDSKEMFLKEVGNVEEVEQYLNFDDEKLAKKLQGKSFSTWKTQLNHVTDDLDDMKTKWLELVKTRAKDDEKFPETLFCLLRHIRNRLTHSREEMKEINVMKLFPDLVVTAYKCAEERDWEVKRVNSSIFRNERPAAAAAEAATASSSHSSDAAELHLRDKAQQDPGAQLLSDTPKVYSSIFRNERPAAAAAEAASASSSHSSDAAELHLRDKAQQDPGAQLLSDDTPKVYSSIFRNERPAAAAAAAEAASASSSHSSDAAELHLRDKAQQDPGAQLLSDTPKEGHHSRNPGQVSSQGAAGFVDKNRAELISRVTEVMPIADELLSQGVIGRETYSNIHAAPTSQTKMRTIYEGLHSAGAQGKLAFYRILQAQQRLLVKDLCTA